MVSKVEEPEVPSPNLQDKNKIEVEPGRLLKLVETANQNIRSGKPQAYYHKVFKPKSILPAKSNNVVIRYKSPQEKRIYPGISTYKNLEIGKMLGQQTSFKERVKRNLHSGKNKTF